MSLIYKDDVGADIIINLNNTTIPGGTTIYVIAEKPTGATVDFILEAGELNLVTGIITHKSKAGELDTVGEYRLQLRRISSGVDTRSDIGTFTVYKRLGV
jgi:hypothetical protein